MTLRQTAAPPHLSAGSTRSSAWLTYAAIPFGSLCTGLVAGWLGVCGALFFGAAGLLIPVAVIVWSPVPKLRESFRAA